MWKQTSGTFRQTGVNDNHNNDNINNNEENDDYDCNNKIEKMNKEIEKTGLTAYIYLQTFPCHQYCF